MTGFHQHDYNMCIIYGGAAFITFILLGSHGASWISGLQFYSNSEIFQLLYFQIFLSAPPPFLEFNRVHVILLDIFQQVSESLLISFLVFFSLRVLVWIIYIAMSLLFAIMLSSAKCLQ